MLLCWPLALDAIWLSCEIIHSTDEKLRNLILQMFTILCLQCYSCLHLEEDFRLAANISQEL